MLVLFIQWVAVLLALFLYLYLGVVVFLSASALPAFLKLGLSTLAVAGLVAALIWAFSPETKEPTK